VLDVALKDDFVTWALERGLVDERRAWDRGVLASIARRIIETAMGSAAPSRVPWGMRRLPVSHDHPKG
jgi:hypothetical protein